MDVRRIIDECEGSPITAWAEGRPKLDAPPWLVYIGVTNACNNRCVVCARDKVMRHEQGLMDFELFKKVVDGLPKGVKKVYLMKQGEPLLSKRLEDFAGYIRQKRPEIYLAFHTNGVLANEDRMRRLLPLIDSVGVSISATSRELYNKVHGSDSFEEVVENLSAISDILLEMPKGKRPHVFIDYVYQEANASEDEPEVVEFFRSRFPGLSSVDFHWVFNFQGVIEEGKMDVYNKLSFEDFPCCIFPWSAMTVCHDGKVSYCFVESRENRFLGDLSKESFEDIWNGAEYSGFREKMTKRMFGELKADGFGCAECSWLWAMRSQSPRNLAGGYTIKESKAQGRVNFEDVLELSGPERFSCGAESYQRGDIVGALGIFSLIAASSTDDEYSEGARLMVERCKKVLDGFKNLALWQRAMAEEGTRPEEKQCRYYSISG